MERLTARQDDENSGLLVKLPCKVGDTVYLINDMYRDYKLYSIEEHKIRSIHCTITEDEVSGYLELNVLWNVSFKDIGTKLFFTKPEAEQKFKELNK